MSDVSHDQKVWTVVTELEIRPERVAEDGGEDVVSLWKAGKSLARKFKLSDSEDGRVEFRFWSEMGWIWPQTSEIQCPRCCA